MLTMNTVAPVACRIAYLLASRRRAGDVDWYCLALFLLVVSLEEAAESDESYRKKSWCS